MAQCTDPQCLKIGELERAVTRDEGNLQVVYYRLLSSTPHDANFERIAARLIAWSSKAGALAVGSIRIFSAHRGPLSHARIRYRGSRAHTARSNVPEPRLVGAGARSARPAPCVKKKRSRMTGSGSLRLQISLLAAETTVVLRQPDMQSTTCGTKCSSR